MRLLAFLHRRFHWINLPGALLMLLLQRTPILSLFATAEQLVSASSAGVVLKSGLAVAAALGAVNTLVGATPLVPTSGTATALSVTVGTPVSVFYTVNGTQTPPASWTVNGQIPPGLNFSGLTSPGTVNAGSLHLSGTPTTNGVYVMELETFQLLDGRGFGSPIYTYTITVTGGSANSPPSITTQPSSQTVTAGSAVTFTAAATGTPTPTFQWQKDGANIAGATNSSYSIASAAAGDAGSYTVVATNSAGAVTSSAATLTVNAATAAPSFTTQPSSQSVTVGSAVTFTAAASGNPTPTYQWRKDGTNIAGATSSSYSIASAAAGDAGSYTVVATNSAGAATSNAATLTVSAATAAPSLTTQPISQSVTAGSSVTFMAVANGNPTPTYQWQKEGANIAGATSSSYTIASAAAGDAGNYTVVATNSVGAVTSSAATLTVNAATAAPSFTTQPASQTVALGGSVTLSATAAGTPTPTYQWRKDGANLAGVTNSSFTIASIATSDAGSYTVVATNSAGSATSNAATITVTTAAPTQVNSITATTGHSASFSAGRVSGTIQWQVSTNGGGTWTNVANDSTYSGATSTLLTVLSATAGLNGAQYRYVLTSNGVVSTSNAAMLTVAQAFFPYPTSIILDATGNLYVGDANANTIQKVNTSGQVSLLAGASGTAGSADGTGAGARFNQPAGIVLLPSGTLVVTDSANATLRTITADGAVAVLAGQTGIRGGADGAGMAASFSLPVGLALAKDGSGTLFVADAMNDTIRQVTPSGTVTTLAGSAGALGVTNGRGSAARFNFPTGVAADSTGNVYVADTTNNTIRKITATADVTTLAGLEGVSGFDDGTGSHALFNQPGGLATDSAGNLYVADTGNSTIRKITPAGAVSTLAGTPGVAGLEDGTGTNALFNQPKDLAIDAAGNLYVADTGNAALRKVTPDGVVTTLALSALPTPTPTPTPTPAPTPMPSSSGGGGGGGAPSLWFVSLLTLLALGRHTARRRQGSGAPDPV